MIITRAILKGRILGTVETRNMFIAQFPLASTLDSDIQTALLTWVDSVYSPIIAYLSNSWEAYSLQIQEYVTGAWNDVVEIPDGFGGTGGADFEEFQTAVLLTARTGGLKVLGRKFIAGIVKSATLEGSLTSAVLVLAATTLANYITPFVSPAGKVGTPGVIDKHGTFWPFIGGTVGSILSTLRRRKPGYGI